MKKVVIAISILSLAACHSSNGKKAPTAEDMKEESKKVNEFLDRKFDEYVSRHPETASSLGLKTGYDSWDDRSDKAAEHELDIMKDNLDSLKNDFDLDKIDAQTQLSVQMYREEYQRAEEGRKWWHYGYELTQMGGVNNDIPAFLINVHRIDSLPDAKAYISRLKKIPAVFNQTLVNLAKSESMGIIPPAFTFPYVKKDLETFIAGCAKTDATNILLSDFTAKVDSLKNISGDEKKKLVAEAEHVIKTDVRDAYKKLLDYWTTLTPKANAKGNNGVWSLPNGDAYYAYELQWHTTTNMTPDEVYQTGVNEVARIQKEMRAIMKEVGYKNDSLQDFFEYVRTDPKFKYSNDDKGRAELLHDANMYIDSMRVKLPDLFITMPKAPLVVKEVEKFREQSAGGAFYEDPAEDGSRPGRYYVNTYDMNDEPKYQMEALTYHEAIPGHHMQISIAQELKGIPKFRRHEFFTAYVEGWGLYAEQLGKDVGKYQDPYSDFGRLSMEIFRAARLVVDVGIHYKHWTKQQAVDYFMKNTANAPGDVEKEIERYFIWPGQATAYKIGMLKILALRQKAKTELGDKFDIRQFHEVVLTNGAVSLGTLESLVNKWIAEKKKAGA